MTSAVRVLAYADMRLLRRDPLLKWMLLLPLVLALLLRVVMPKAQAGLLAAGGGDLVPYFPLVAGGYLTSAPGIVGMVIGFLLLDERDDRTLTALRVTPLSMRRYLAYRIVLPLVVGTASTLVGYPLIGITPLPFRTLLATTTVAALTAPLLALILAAVAPNKVAGLALVKVLNGVSLFPMAAFFLAPPLQFAAGVFPTYWPMRAVWSAAAGEGYAWFLAFGSASSLLAIWIAASVFERRLLLRG